MFSIWTEQGKDRKSASKPCRVHHVKYRTEWITSWNQNCWQRYQQTQICRWCHYNERKWRGAKEPLDEGERGEWKAGLKLSIQKMNIMVSGPITSWRLEGEKVETVSYFIFLGSQINADSDCGHKIKRCLLLGRITMKESKYERITMKAEISHCRESSI